MFGNKWPYSNIHELNLDWILDELKKQNATIADFVSLNTITYANPLQWDITKQYPKNCVVVDSDGNGYLSVQPVPTGVQIDNTDYWTVIGNFSALWETVKYAITPSDEGHNSRAKYAHDINSLFWIDNNLCVATKAIAVDDLLQDNYSVTDIDARLSALRQAINTNSANISANKSELAKKIPYTSTNGLQQNVSGGTWWMLGDGDMYLRSNGILGLRHGGETRLSIESGVTGLGNTTVPTALYGDVQLRSMSTAAYNTKFDSLKMMVGGKQVDIAALKKGVEYDSIDPSPTDIRKYQTLKMDGTDDITETINTHTKDEPLYIPAGTYLVSKPLTLKHSLYGAGSSRDPRRGTSDTILKYTTNQTGFGNLGVITVVGDDVTGNIVVAHLDIICNGDIGGVVYKTNVYTDNSLYDVSIYGVKTYGVYINPTVSTLNRFCYVDHVSVWGYSDNSPVERVAGNIGFYIGTKAPDCFLNNVLSMVCQTGFDIRKNTYGVNWITFNGIPANGSGGAEANTWWQSTIGLKIVNDDVHITNLYLDTCRNGIVFDGPGKSAAYINNLVYTCEESTADTGEGNAAIALIGTSPNPQLIVEGGVINRTSKVSTTIQTTGTYPVTNAVCKMDGVNIYTSRDNIFTNNSQYICRSGEHRCIDLAITNQHQYTVAGQAETGDPAQYKMFAILPIPAGGITSQGSIRICDRNNVDMTVYISNSPQTGDLFGISAVDNRALNMQMYAATAGTNKTITYNLADSLDKLYYAVDDYAITFYCKRPASYEYTVIVDGFTQGNSPVMLDRIRNTDGTPMDYPRWSDHDNMTPIKTLRPSIS